MLLNSRVNGRKARSLVVRAAMLGGMVVVVCSDAVATSSAGDTSAPSSTVESGGQVRLLRDLNGDGVVNVLDAAIAKGLAKGGAENPEAGTAGDGAGESPGGGLSGGGGETVFITGIPTYVPGGSTLSLLVKLSGNTTPLFGYSVAIRALPSDAQALGSVTADVPQTNFFASQNLIIAGGAPIDPFFSIIQPWSTGGVFISANTDDGSTVLATPDVNDVLAEVTFEVSKDAEGSFTLVLGPATALSDGDGFAVPFVFSGGEISICADSDLTCDGVVDIDDLFLLLGFWGDCPKLPPDIDGSGEVGIDDLFLLLADWGESGSPADLNQSGTVDIDDLFALLNNWGQEEPFCPDLNDDGTVDIDDLFQLLGQWGVPGS